MDPFTESELFDEDMPAASPLSVEEPTEALRPSATDGRSALAVVLARRWPACVAGLLVAVLAVGLLSGTSVTHPQPPVPDRTHGHDRYRPRRGVNHRHSAGKLGCVSVAPPAPEVGAGSSAASDMPPNLVVPRPTRVEPVGTERPASPVHVGEMEQTQFDYLGR
jgi:hypothetical protein